MTNAATSARNASGPARAAATEAARIARIGYREGKFGQLDLLDAERTLPETRAAAIDALAAYHDAQARRDRSRRPPPARGEVLADLGYTAIEAEGGAAGLKAMHSGARIDLLVTDVGLPGGPNGRQVADAVRVVRPDLKVLFIIGNAENALLSHGHLDPGMHAMTKPFAMEALATRIAS